jgi:DNA-directed RNA polymerase specialized sigma24 family protein
VEGKQIDRANPFDSTANDSDRGALKRIERAVWKLPRLQREIFLAARLDDMSNAEIAERTGLAASEVERALAKALASIDRRTSTPPRRWWHRC